MQRSCLIAGILSALAVLPTACLAAQLHITDCEGVTKVMYDADSAVEHRVDLILADGSPYINSQLKVPMTNNDTGAVLERGPIGNVISYDHISAGDWKLCPMPKDLALQDVRVIPTTSNDSAGIAPVALGGLALIGGGIALAGSDDDDNNTDNSPLTPLGELDGPDVPIQIANNNGASGSGSKNPSQDVSAEDDEDCRVDEEPTPISPFS